MPILPLALPTSSNQGDHGHSGAAALINCYAVPVGGEQKNQVLIRARPGLDSVVTLATTGGVRGQLEVDGVVYVVGGRTLFQVDSSGTSTLIGGIPSDGYVGMARNQRGVGVQTVIAASGLSYVVVGGSLARITDTDLIAAIDVCVINRSAIFASPDGRMMRSEIDDVTSLDGLDLAEAEAVPDGLHRVVDRGSDLIAIGPRSTEILTDTGSEAFGFSRNTVLNIGCVGPSSVVKATILGQTVSDAVAWVANNLQGRYAGVVMLSGFTVAKISTPWVDRLIDQEADKSAIQATSWIDRGRSFLAWRLTDTTIVYDASTGLWHENRSRDVNGNLTAWNIASSTVLEGRVLAGHATEPKLYWLDHNTYDDDGDELIMRVRTPPLHAHPGRIELSRLDLDVLPGSALASGSAQDTSPTIAMRMSHDGVTWNPERTRSLGRQGQTQTRVFWTRNGTFATASFEFTMSAAIAREILSAKWDGTVLPP